MRKRSGSFASTKQWPSKAAASKELQLPVRSPNEGASLIASSALCLPHPDGQSRGLPNPSREILTDGSLGEVARPQRSWVKSDGGMPLNPHGARAIWVDGD